MDQGRPGEDGESGAVCERYGGGGHARVGAISFPPDQADEGADRCAGDCGATAF